MHRSMTMNSIVGFANESCGSMACPSASHMKRTKTVSQLTALVRSTFSEPCSGSNQSSDSDQLRDEHHSGGGLSESENGSDHDHSQTDDEDEIDSCSSNKTVPISIPAVSCTSLRAQHAAVKKLIYAQQVHEMKRAAKEYKEITADATGVRNEAILH